MTPLIWLALWLAAAVVLLVLGAIGAYPVGYRRGYAEAATVGGRHRKDGQEAVIVELPRAGRLPLERLADPTPLPGEDWRFAGGWDEGASGSAEYELLTQTAEQPAADPYGPTAEDLAEYLIREAENETPSGFTRRMAREVEAMIAEWEGDTNYWLHTHRADT
jgi:hypothetical protein